MVVTSVYYDHTLVIKFENETNVYVQIVGIKGLLP